MNAEQRTACIKAIAELLKKHNLEGAKISADRECVCPIGADAIQDDSSLTIEKNFPFDKKADVDAFKEALKETGYQGVKAAVAC